MESTSHGENITVSLGLDGYVILAQNCVVVPYRNWLHAGGSSSDHVNQGTRHRNANNTEQEKNIQDFIGEKGR